MDINIDRRSKICLVYDDYQTLFLTCNLYCILLLGYKQELSSSTAAANSDFRYCKTDRLQAHLTVGTTFGH